MKFDEWLKETVSSPISWVAPALGGISTYLNMRGEEKARAEESRIQNERTALLHSGLAQGRSKGEQLYGMNDQEVGANIQDVIRRRQEMMNKPSMAAEQVRSAGAQQQRQAVSRGASEAQKRQIALDTSAKAGMLDEQMRQENLNAFQSLIGNIAANKSALELGYGGLSVASQYIAPPTGSQGLLSQLLGPLI